MKKYERIYREAVSSPEEQENFERAIHTQNKSEDQFESNKKVLYNIFNFFENEKDVDSVALFLAMRQDIINTKSFPFANRFLKSVGGVKTVYLNKLTNIDNMVDVFKGYPLNLLLPIVARAINKLCADENGGEFTVDDLYEMDDLSGAFEFPEKD